MLEVRNLSRSFNSKIAVDQVSFSLKPGKITGLLGPNGAGKTTTMRLITGYLEPSSGNIFYQGRDIQEDLQAIQRRLGYLPESAPLYYDMLVSEYLEFMAEIRDVPESNRQTQIQKMIEVCELSTHLNFPIAQLSKGFKQRVALAGTLIHNPEIIILDEPTSGLDPNQISHIRNLIKNLAKDKILILSTHILQEVEDVCDEVIIIHKGKIVANSSVENLHSGFQVLIETNAEESEVKKIFQNKIFLSVELDKDSKPKEGFFSYIISLSEDKPEEVFRVLAKSNFVVREMKIFRKSLESIFEELTRG
jgi:ABC-2 type transport system ATP-binding protein